MKVVHIFWGLTFGGIETMLINIVNEQVKLGARVTVIIINDLYEETLVHAFAPEVDFICLRRKQGSRNLNFVFKLNWILWKMNPEAIHLHGSPLFRYVSRWLSHGLCSTIHALPLGTVRHGGLLCQLFPMLIRNYKGNTLYIDKIPRVFAISQAVHDELKEKYGVESVVVNNGIKSSSFKPRSDKEIGNALRVVMVSRLDHEKKGQDLLIKAIVALDNDISVDFIGDGESMSYLKLLSEELGVSRQVRFLGKRSQDYIAEHLCEYDLFVQPSRYEGFGLTVAEAMAANVPVLVSSGQGPAEVTCNDCYGWTFENGSVEDLTSKIKYIADHYPEVYAKAQKARQYVIDVYDVSITARRYLELYN